MLEGMPVREYVSNNPPPCEPEASKALRLFHCLSSCQRHPIAQKACFLALDAGGPFAYLTLWTGGTVFLLILSLCFMSAGSSQVRRWQY